MLLAVPVGGYYFLAWQHDRELDAVIAELNQTDPHWRLDDLLDQRPLVADENNPALVVAKIDALMRPAGSVVDFKHQHLFDCLMPPVARLNGEQVAALREGLARHKDALALARTLMDFCAEGRHVIKVAPDWYSTNLDSLQRTREVMWLPACDAMLRAEDEDGVGAVESCRALLVTARSVGVGPCLIVALIRFSGQARTVDALERTLAQTEASAAQLEAMQRLLAREIEAPVLLEAMRGERAGADRFMYALKQGTATTKISALRGPAGPGANSLEEWLLDHLPAVASVGRPQVLRLMSKNVEAAKLSPEKQEAAFAAVEQEAINSSGAFVRMLGLPAPKVGAAHRRMQALMRCAIVGVAAERYRIKHGRWPAALADLCQDGHLPVLPTDPYDGRPLRYKALPDGVLIYSVGMDGIDNGGLIDRANSSLGRGVDLGFQLWDVPARRQAPLPPRAPQD